MTTPFDSTQTLADQKAELDELFQTMDTEQAQFIEESTAIQNQIDTMNATLNQVAVSLAEVNAHLQLYAQPTTLYPQDTIIDTAAAYTVTTNSFGEEYVIDTNPYDMSTDAGLAVQDYVDNIPLPQLSEMLRNQNLDSLERYLMSWPVHMKLHPNT